MPQVKLAGGCARLSAVGKTVYDQGTGAANALAAVGIESNGLFAPGDQLLVHLVQHLEEGHVRDDILGLVDLELAGSFPIRLSPNSEGEIHRACLKCRLSASLRARRCDW
jgi:hypothetical protein